MQLRNVTLNSLKAYSGKSYHKVNNVPKCYRALTCMNRSHLRKVRYLGLEMQKNFNTVRSNELVIRFSTFTVAEKLFSGFLYTVYNGRTI
jgi:hypothetical protein